MRLLLILLLIGSFAVKAQDTTSAEKIDLGGVEFNFLYGYYDQDGVHSAVTGGLGSEELNVHAPAIQLNIPLDTNLRLKFDGGVDVITSASTDKIDFVMSSASRVDAHHHAKLAVEHQPTAQSTYSIGYSYSMESDYFSNGAHVTYAWQSKDRNTGFNLSSNLFFDHVTWGWHQFEGSVRLIYPQELRFKEWETKTRRYSYNLGINVTRNFHKRFNASIFTVPTYQHGLLITPFHRVYFRDADQAVVERLPYSRIKIPVGVRANYFVLNRAILRLMYRFYWDDFGISAHTAELSVPIKVLRSSISIQPFYRFYHQTASNYFAPIYTHDQTAEFYTSDYDQSAFISNKFGIGLTMKPRRRTNLKPGKHFGWRSVSFRYARYLRSDGLSMHVFSSIFSFGQ